MKIQESYSGGEMNVDLSFELNVKPMASGM